MLPLLLPHLRRRRRADRAPAALAARRRARHRPRQVRARRGGQPGPRQLVTVDDHDLGRADTPRARRRRRRRHLLLLLLLLGRCALDDAAAPPEAPLLAAADRLEPRAERRLGVERTRPCCCDLVRAVALVLGDNLVLGRREAVEAVLGEARRVGAVVRVGIGRRVGPRRLDGAGGVVRRQLGDAGAGRRLTREGRARRGRRVSRAVRLVRLARGGTSGCGGGGGGRARRDGDGRVLVGRPGDGRGERVERECRGAADRQAAARRGGRGAVPGRGGRRDVRGGRGLAVQRCRRP